jgi:hypothetical protein
MPRPAAINFGVNASPLSGSGDAGENSEEMDAALPTWVLKFFRSTVYGTMSSSELLQDLRSTVSRT